jgi:hypothetical protein
MDHERSRAPLTQRVRKLLRAVAAVDEQQPLLGAMESRHHRRPRLHARGHEDCLERFGRGEQDLGRVRNQAAPLAASDVALPQPARWPVKDA